MLMPELYQQATTTNKTKKEKEKKRTKPTIDDLVGSNRHNQRYYRVFLAVCYRIYFIRTTS